MEDEEKGSLPIELRLGGLWAGLLVLRAASVTLKQSAPELRGTLFLL